MGRHAVVPLILAGGSGSRLWPVSRESMAKQFLPLMGERSTYQQALARVDKAGLFESPIVMTALDSRSYARQQSEEIGVKSEIVLEPERRDSGPAIASGALLALQRNPDAIVLTLAADHVILDQDSFQEDCWSARAAASGGRIVTFGMRPTAPSSSFGYIRPGIELNSNRARAIDAFVEKPDAATAARLIAEGYLWNSGNFMFRADVLLAELTRHKPAMAKAVRAAVAGATKDCSFLHLDPHAFAKAPRESIDRALMEKTDRGAVVEGRFRWSDIGSWDALFEAHEPDAAGNILHGPAFAHKSENCLVHAERHLTAIVGVKDLIVVTTPDAVLVLPRTRSDEVKDLVALLRQKGHPEASNHRRVDRPWGHYELVDLGDRFQVKRLVVWPGGALSLQKHMHRAEHWIVVKGVAAVTVDDTHKLVRENELIYVPAGAVHRLQNPGRITLELVEVQTGSYLGEDDIIRLEDVYGRDCSVVSLPAR